MKSKLFQVLLSLIILLVLMVGCSEGDVNNEDEDDDSDDHTELYIELDTLSGRPGSIVIITGDGFASSLTGNQVTFNDVAATVRSLEYESDGEDQLEVKVPYEATTGIVAFDNGSSKVEGPTFTVIGPHTISSVDPVEAVPGQAVTIYGTDFSEEPTENVVTLNEMVLDVLSASSEELVVEIPEDAWSGPLSVDILGLRVSYPDFKVVTVTDDPFTLESVTPQTGEVGLTISLFGLGYGDDPDVFTVTFNGLAGRVIGIEPFGGYDVLTVQVPDGAETGPLVLQRGDQQQTWTNDFVVSTAMPSINPVSLTLITLLPGFTFTLLGSGFSPEASFNHVSIGGESLHVVSALSTYLELEVPKDFDFGDGTSVSGPIQISVNSKVIEDVTFTVFKKPIVSLRTTSGNVGDEIEISGMVFPKEDPTALEVFFSGDGTLVKATVTEVNYYLLTVVVPDGAVDGPVSIVVYDGETGISSSDFDVTGG